MLAGSKFLASDIDFSNIDFTGSTWTDTEWIAVEPWLTEYDDTHCVVLVVVAVLVNLPALHWPPSQPPSEMNGRFDYYKPYPAPYIYDYLAGSIHGPIAATDVDFSGALPVCAHAEAEVDEEEGASSSVLCPPSFLHASLRVLVRVSTPHARALPPPSPCPLGMNRLHFPRQEH